MTAVVLDASVLAALYVQEPASAASEAVFARLADHSDLHAPDFALLEVANVLWKRVRRGEFGAELAITALEDLKASAIRLHATGPLVTQALALALAHGFTAYDAVYVALATRVGGVLITNDRGLRRNGAEAGLPVVAPDEMP